MSQSACQPDLTVWRTKRFFRFPALANVVAAELLPRPWTATSLKFREVWRRWSLNGSNFKLRCGRGVNGHFLWARQRFKVCPFGNLGTTRQLGSLISSGHLAAIMPNYFARSLEIEMDKDRVSGAAKQVAGSVKEAAGKLTGDSKMQSDGKADKVVGKVQNSIGGAKDAVREAIDGKKR